MSITTSHRRIRYVASRRWPGEAGTRSDVAVRVGRLLAPDEVTDLDHFLSARWCLYVPGHDGSLTRVDVAHEAWSLHEAEVEHLEDELVAAGGYPRLAAGAPAHVRFSPGVEVDVGIPRRLT